MTTLGWSALIVASLLTLCPPPVRGRMHEVPEYHVKAAFLYNFCKFIEWPEERFANPTSPIVLGVTDAGPFGAALAALDGRRVGRRHLRVREVGAPASAATCHMLFVNGDATHAKSYVVATAGRAVVTVGEDPAFLEDGGMIQFVRKQAKVRFQIDHERLKRAGLTVSSHLLKLADDRSERNEVKEKDNE